MVDVSSSPFIRVMGLDEARDRKKGIVHGVGKLLCML